MDFVVAGASRGAGVTASQAFFRTVTQHEKAHTGFEPVPPP